MTAAPKTHHPWRMIAVAVLVAAAMVATWSQTVPAIGRIVQSFKQTAGEPFLTTRAPWGFEYAGGNREHLLSVDAFKGSFVGDYSMRKVGELTDLKLLHLHESTPMPPGGLRHLTNLTNLKSLRFSGTRVSDPGWSHLSSLKNLEIFRTYRVDNSDEAFKHIGLLTNLKILTVEFEGTMGEEAVHLRKLNHLEDLSLVYTEFEEEALKHIGTLIGLKQLSFGGAQISEASIKRLQESLPSCEIRWSPPPPAE